MWDDAIHQAFDTLDEVAMMLDPSEVHRMRQALDELEAMFDEAWGGLGLGGG